MLVPARLRSVTVPWQRNVVTDEPLLQTPARPAGRDRDQCDAGRPEWVSAIPYLLAVGFFAAYSVFAVHRHRTLQTGGFDLGLFEQAIKGYAHLGPPVADLRGPGFNLLGDHFHPILILLAPVYRLFPSAMTLLLAQSALFAISVVPVARMAGRCFEPDAERPDGSADADRRFVWLGPVAASICVGAAYGMSWGLQEAAAFDFHEVCFAVPFMAFALERLLLGRWLAVIPFAVALVLVKEDLGLTVAAIGFVLFLRRQRKLGVCVAIGGVLASAAAFVVLIPAFNPTHQYGFWGHMDENKAASTGLLATATHFVQPWMKTYTLIMLLAPVAFLALRSDLVLIAGPTLLWRFATENPFYWTDSRHYNAVLMPIVFMAFIDTVRRARRSDRQTVRVAVSLAIPVVLAMGLVISSNRPFGQMTRSETWQANPWADAVRADMVRLIPDGATVGASNRVAAQLTSRCQVYLFPDFRRVGVNVDWVAISLGGDWPLEQPDQLREVDLLKMSGYEEVLRRDDLIIMRRSGR